MDYRCQSRRGWMIAALGVVALVGGLLGPVNGVRAAGRKLLLTAKPMPCRRDQARRGTTHPTETVTQTRVFDRAAP